VASLILTSYFSSSKHPQLGDPHIEGVSEDGRVLQNSIEYIKSIYSSAKNLNLNLVVFHDNLTKDFVTEFSTERILFEKVGSSPFSCNDWRFFCFRRFLRENKDFLSKKYSCVFTSDASDVTIKNDPKILFEENKDSYSYFVCKDSIRLSEFPYAEFHKKMNWKDYVWIKMMEGQLDLINMGVIGGSFSDMIKFLDYFCLTRLKMGIFSFNSDMWVGQYIFRCLLSENGILIGDPVTSEFKKYQKDREDVYFIHK
jgi:hypothetical protein